MPANRPLELHKLYYEQVEDKHILFSYFEYTDSSQSDTEITKSIHNDGDNWRSTPGELIDFTTDTGSGDTRRGDFYDPATHRVIGYITAHASEDEVFDDNFTIIFIDPSLASLQA